MASGVCLDVEVNPKMPWVESKAIPEGDGPFAQHDEFRSGEPTMAELYRMSEKWWKEYFDVEAGTVVVNPPVL